jgi:hypothetical protein
MAISGIGASGLEFKVQGSRFKVQFQVLDLTLLRRERGEKGERGIRTKSPLLTPGVG